MIDNIIKIVKGEMKASMGCTEPVAIGLAVSNTCRYLTSTPKKIKLKVSSNIFKNAYCVKIPNSNETGIPLAVALGYLLADMDNDMEIFAKVTAEKIKQAYNLLSQGLVEVEAMSSMQFYIEVWADSDTESVHTLTIDKHDNLVFAKKNDEILFDARVSKMQSNNHDDGISKLTVGELVEIAKDVELSKIDFLNEAVELNTTASKAGLSGDYGMNIGRSIKRMLDDGAIPKDLFYHVKMVVAAASDCRMGGGAYSAMTVLGSGNQGFQATLPAIAACEFLGKDRETVLRSVFMAIIITIRQKYKVGRLSPICGATLSGAASSAVITWLLGGNIEQMEGAMRTMYANLTGMMCDGAKDGCAIKLATCSGEAVMAARLALYGSMASKSDGIVSARIEDSIDNIARLSKEGMAPIDMNVIDIMMAKK